jgi:hypothetical protein
LLRTLPRDLKAVHVCHWDGTLRTTTDDIYWALCYYPTSWGRLRKALIRLGIGLALVGAAYGVHRYLRSRKPTLTGTDGPSSTYTSDEISREPTLTGTGGPSSTYTSDEMSFLTGAHRSGTCPPEAEPCFSSCDGAGDCLDSALIEGFRHSRERDDQISFLRSFRGPWCPSTVQPCYAGCDDSGNCMDSVLLGGWRPKKKT